MAIKHDRLNQYHFNVNLSKGDIESSKLDSTADE